MGETIIISCGFCNYERFTDGGDGFIYCELCNSKHDPMIYIDLGDDLSDCESSSQLSESLKNLDLNQNKEIMEDTINITCRICNNVGFIQREDTFLYCVVCRSKLDENEMRPDLENEDEDDHKHEGSTSLRSRNAPAKLLSTCEPLKNLDYNQKKAIMGDTVNITCGICNNVGFIVGEDEFLHCGVCGLTPDLIEMMTIAAEMFLSPCEPLKNLDYNQKKV